MQELETQTQNKNYGDKQQLTTNTNPTQRITKRNKAGYDQHASPLIDLKNFTLINAVAQLDLLHVYVSISW